MSEIENQVETPKETNAQSVIAIVLGVISLVIPVIGFFIAIPGIIYAIKSMKTVKVTNEPGYGLSVTGLVCSIISIAIHILIVLFFIFIAFFAFSGYSDQTTFLIN